MNNKRIYIKRWLELKPYDTQTITDGYYLRLSNEVKRKLIRSHQSILSENFEEEYIDLLSCFIVSYFEDIISETNIWTSFVDHHKELYNNPLPFYETKEYYEGEINEQDVRFLIWYFFNTVQINTFINPHSPFLFVMAVDIIDLLEGAYEYAPENKVLKKHYKIDEAESDFYVARNLIDTVLFKSYLFYTDTWFDLRESTAKLFEEQGTNENLIGYLNENRDAELHQNCTRLLSLKGKEWAAKIIGKGHPLSKCFLNISQKISAFFLYKGQDDHNIFIEHIASSKKFSLVKKSFDHHDDLQKIDTIVFMGIAKWKEEWWFSGIYFQKEFNADLVLDEKKSIESGIAVNFLDHHHQSEKINEALALQFNAFKGFNNGSQIAFMPSNKIDEFIREYTAYFNQSLNVTKRQRGKVKRMAQKEALWRDEEKMPINYSEVSESGLVFFNPKRGVEIALAVNSAFPLPGNKYFKEQDNEEHIMRLLFAEEISTELVMYCIGNCKPKLPLIKVGEKDNVLNDIDFLLRFWKKNTYHAVPSMTLTQY